MLSIEMTHRYKTPGFSIALAEGSAPARIQLFKVGKFYHPQYGEFDITPKILEEMKKNFDEKVRGIDLALDYQHENEKEAAAWFKELIVDQSGMWAEIEWTPQGKQDVADKVYRYVSPEFQLSYQDNETLKEYGAVLLGAGLTNRPFIKRMEPVVELAEGGADSERAKLHQAQQERSKKYGIEVVKYSALQPASGDPTSDEDFGDPVNYKFPLGDKAQASNARVRFKQFANEIYSDSKGKNIVHERIVRKELALGITPSFDAKDALDAALPEDIKAKISKPIKTSEGGYQMTPEEMKAKIAELEAALAKANGDHAAAMGEVQKYKDAQKMSEKEASFTKMLTEGKAVAAQKEAFMNGDLVKFAELAQPVKLTPAGSGDGGKADAGGDVDEKIHKLAEEKVSKKEAKDYVTAVKMVLSENPELSKQKYA